MSERFVFEAIGTHWEIDILQDVPVKLYEAITVRIAEFDKTYSRFRADSLVTEIAKKAGVYAFPKDAAPLFALYERVYRSTNGLVTPLIGQVLVQAGYDAQYSFKKGELKVPPAWDDAMKFNPLTNELSVFQSGVLLDFGAAGKGYLIDLVGELIEGAGVF
jgi:thiamine biosynthesis lipoprotein